jgi:hypothetical protein
LSTRCNFSSRSGQAVRVVLLRSIAEENCIWCQETCSVTSSACQQAGWSIVEINKNQPWDKSVPYAGSVLMAK